VRGAEAIMVGVVMACEKYESKVELSIPLVFSLSMRSSGHLAGLWSGGYNMSRLEVNMTAWPLCSLSQGSCAPGTRACLFGGCAGRASHLLNLALNTDSLTKNALGPSSPSR
jgi:hypothetical protein